ncbi:hypothetical protein EVJ58_g610 [Rhodofomes roseus]|uniref:DUF6589 domain-containing protein n=1 Tax=Rhodofomes roseus TaxID=34475 RepID=A0A4Y9Z3H2_9APHY|nr:hypothetical protein EVJ58_g610 [Rhodofomes roseus]
MDSTKAAHMDAILLEIQRKGWTIGAFLNDLLTVPARGSMGASSLRAQMVSKFLNGGTAVGARQVVEAMYQCRYGIRKKRRNTAGQSANAVRPEGGKLMAREHLNAWAISTVEELLDREAHGVVSKKGGFHLRNKDVTWQFVHSFSMENILSLLETRGSTVLRVLAAIAVPKKRRPDVAELEKPGFSYKTHFSQHVPSGRGNNSRNPYVILLVAAMLLMHARNAHFTLFQKIVGVWLFAQTAAHSVYAVLGRVGLSVSYTTVLNLLRSLSNSAKVAVRRTATARAFLAIYDNLNRKSRVWDPDLGEKDIMYNGTAATLVELEDCDVEQAFDVKVLREARAKEDRKKLTIDTLYNRIDWARLNAVIAMHVLNILTEAVPALEIHRENICEQFKTTLAIHRMREGRQTKLHPLATSDFNEGVTQENASVLDDIFIDQLKLSKEEVDRLLVIVGGDQSTIEKLRNLKKFMATCPHGYTRYGWVLPLIQLWHMGWADLERVLRTHWGKTQGDDLSAFRSINILLGRKVKDEKRPEYYSTLRLILDTLKADVLDCFRVHLRTDNLNAYFTTHQLSFSDLLKLSETIRDHYICIGAYERALHPDETVAEFFVPGKPSKPRATFTGVDCSVPSVPPFRGDQMLANSILRLLDSMLHYEFQCAIAEGDIGRVMNVMAVWTFTFTGSGHNKYANELIELTCQFEFEFSGALQKAILNNWLCNLSGIPGCWFPMDLLQEKNIKQLKKMSQKRNADFGGEFFQDVIALNIRAFILATTSMKETVRLARTSSIHRRTVKQGALNELARNLTELELHKFCAGRASTHIPRNDFEAGYEQLEDGNKLRDFVKRTLRDAGAIHETDSESQGVVPDEAEASGGNGVRVDLPMPSMQINGLLVVADEDDSDKSDGASSDIAEGHEDDSDAAEESDMESVYTDDEE